MTLAESPNAAQITHWNTVAGESWVEMQEMLDRQIEPLGRAAMAALAPALGEHILDIGCGCGQTSLQLAEAVGPAGRVTGADISVPMLAVARRRAAGLGHVELREADVQVEPFAAESFDAAFSRFGIMFFSEPETAFANIRRALKPGGRIGFVCWRRLDLNEWMTMPLAAALPALGDAVTPPPPPDPTAPGPYAFADGERLRSILVAAGFADIRIDPLDTPVTGGSPEEALAVSLRVGPLGAMLREHPEWKDVIAGPVRDALAARATDGLVRLHAAAWIVSARRP